MVPRVTVTTASRRVRREKRDVLCVVVCFLVFACCTGLHDTTDGVLGGAVSGLETKNYPEKVTLDRSYAPPPPSAPYIETIFYVTLSPTSGSEPGAILPSTCGLPGEAKAGGRPGD